MPIISGFVVRKMNPTSNVEMNRNPGTGRGGAVPTGPIGVALHYRVGVPAEARLPRGYAGEPGADA